jgi:hypothetical protein
METTTVLEASANGSHRHETTDDKANISFEKDKPKGQLQLFSTNLNEVALHDKQFIKAFLLKATTRGLNMTFYKSKAAPEASTSTSKVTVFLRFGKELSNGRFSQPRFVWEADDGIVGVVELFDIRLFEKADAPQLKEFSSATLGRSIVLMTKRNETFIFEASTEDGAVRFIQGLRWVIARLAFNIIIGNPGVSCELLDVEEISGVQTRAMNDLTTYLTNDHGDIKAVKK